MKKIIAVLFFLVILCFVCGALSEDWFLKEQADFLLPTGLTLIGESAFSGIKAESVYIQDGVTSIGNGAFSDCKYLSRVRIPSSVASIPEDAFDICPPGLRIYGIKGSAAHRFSGRHGFLFLDETTGEIVENNTLPPIPFL